MKKKNITVAVQEN
jgi:hypothetical protein